MIKNLLRYSSSFISKIGGGFILAYHQIDPNLFIKQIELLYKLELVPLNDLVSRKISGKNTDNLFSITFDDGYNDTIVPISDICEKKQWPVTFYPLIDYVDNKPMIWFKINNLERLTQGLNIESINQDFGSIEKHKYFFKSLNDKMITLNRNDYDGLIEKIIKYLLKNNICSYNDIIKQPKAISWDFIAIKSKSNLFSFDSHGVTHNPVVALSTEELETEILDSKKRIFEVTNKEVNHFCYPYGDDKCIGTNAPKIINRFFKSSTTMNRGRINRSDTNYLNRIPIYDKDHEVRFLLKLQTL